MGQVYPLRGSLTRRIALVAVCLLVIPLIIHSFYLYHQEYEWAEVDIQNLLLVFGDERRSQLEQAIDFNWQILDASVRDPSWYPNVEQIQIPASAQKPHYAWVDLKRQLLWTSCTENGQSIGIAMALSQWTKPLGQEPYQIDVSFVDLDSPIPVDSNVVSLELPVRDLRISMLFTVPKNRITALQSNYYLKDISAFLVIFALLGGGAAVWLTMRLGRPLKRLSSTMSRVSEGALHVRYQPDRLGFEVNTLGHQFNDTVEALIQHQQEAEAAKIGRERLAQELRIGRSIQKSMLPTSLPELPGVDISATYLPADEVSGDFYDFLLLPDGRLLIAIADVSGKGISACLYALDARGLLRAFATSMTDLSAMVRQMNRLLYQDSMESSLFVTIWVGIYDPKKRTLEYCNQGHFPSLLRRGEQIEELPGGGIALGVEEEVAPNMGQKHLQVGDRLILFTDGLVDAEDQKGTRLGLKRLQEYLQSTPIDTAEDLLAGLEPLSLLDDVSIVMMSIDG